MQFVACSTTSSGISSWRGRSLGEVDVVRANLSIRSRCDDDRVLAVGVDDDERNACRYVSLVPARGDTCVVQALQRALGELVSPDAADHRHLGAEPRGGDGLIRTLSARDLRERGARDRLAGPRQPLRAGDEVEIDRADDGQAGGHVRETIPSCP